MRRKEPQWTAVERDGNGLILTLLFNMDYTGWSSAVFRRMSKATSTGDLFQEMVVYHSSMAGGKKFFIVRNRYVIIYKAMVDNG